MSESDFPFDYEWALLDRWLQGLIGTDRDYEARLVLNVITQRKQGKIRKLCREHHARYNDGAPGCEVWMAAKQGEANPTPCQVEDFLLVSLARRTEEQGEDDFYDDGCSWCGGDGVQECDDPIQCTYTHFVDGLERCSACRGSGSAKDQVIW